MQIVILQKFQISEHLVVHNGFRKLETSLREVGSIYRRNDEFSCKKANSRNSTVSNEGKRSERIDNGVGVGKSLEPFEAAASKSIPQRAMPTQENLHRSKSPSKNLVQPVWQVDRSWPFESRPQWHAVYWSPSPALHLESSQDIFCHWTIYPTNLKRPNKKKNKLNQKINQKVGLRLQGKKKSWKEQESVFTSFPHAVFSS